MKKKILVVCQHFWPESFRINDICDFLTEEGCEVDVLCGIPNYPGGNFFKGYGVFRNRKEIYNSVSITRVLEIPRGDNSNLRILINYLSFPFFSLFHLPRLLTKKYDKVIIYQLSPVYMAISGILLGKIKRIETIMYVLDLWPENLYSVLKIKNIFLRKLLEKTSHWHYKNVDKLIVISKKMRSRIISITNKEHKKVIFIPQCCEKIYEKSIKDRTLENKFSKGFNILFAGNISPAQDFKTVIEAAKILHSKNIKDINWIIVGDGMSRNWLENEVDSAGLSNNFFFEGAKPIEDIPKYTYIADGLLACLVDSDLLDATIPAKVMSYLAAGRPLLLAMNGEASRIVKKIGCGFTGPSSNAEKLYENIAKLYYMNKSERITMGSLGKNYHFTHFERNMNLQKIYKFIFDN